MSSKYALFDASHIQRECRRRVHWLYGLVLVVILLTLGSMALPRSGQWSMQGVAWVLAGSWIFTVWILTWQLRRVRRTVWCVKISSDEIVGYNHARRKISIEWPAVQRIDLTDEALVVIKSPHCFFEVSTSFPEYAALSHHVIRYADRHDVTVCIDGQPWDQIDIYELYPYRQSDIISGRGS